MNDQKILEFLAERCVGFATVCGIRYEAASVGRCTLSLRLEERLLNPQGYAHGGVFGICFDAHRGWVGSGAGAGVGAGYVKPLSRNGHWRLEVGLQAGFFRCQYDPYQYENPVNPAYHDDLYYYKWTKKPELFKKRQYRWNWFGPTRVGITLTDDLLYRRIDKKGVSFRHTERRVAP